MCGELRISLSPRNGKSLKDPSAKYKDAEKRIRKPKTQFGDESNGLVLHQHDKFRIEAFLPILDKLSKALTLRTQAYMMWCTSASDLLQNF